MSIGSILNMARTAMNAQQMAIQIASQNISNATTTGYSRQRVELTTSLPTVFPYGTIGTGVSVQTITRARDTLLDATFRNDSGAATAADTTNTALSQVQSVFGEPSDTGLSASLDAFWSAWSDLSNDPTNNAAKSVVVEAGSHVASTLNQFASQLDSLDQNNREGMNSDVGQANQISQHIAVLNRQIVSAESNGNTANDLRDARDNLLDQLSTLVGGQVIERSNGGVAVYVSGRMLVDGTTANTLQMNDGQPPTVSFGPSLQPVEGFGGSLGARIDVSANRIPAMMTRLDALASTMVKTVNAIHSAGTVFTGNPPVAGAAGNFFAVTNPPPAGVDPLLTARGMRLDPTLSAATVAASGAGAAGPGDNSVALALSGLRGTAVAITDASGATISTASLSDFFTETVGTLATDTKAAQDESTVQSTLASNAQTRRQSVSGVTTDEELIDVISHQHAYQSAARLVQVVSDMMQTLVTLGQ